MSRSKVTAGTILQYRARVEKEESSGHVSILFDRTGSQWVSDAKGKRQAFFTLALKGLHRAYPDGTRHSVELLD